MNTVLGNSDGDIPLVNDVQKCEVNFIGQLNASFISYHSNQSFHVIYTIGRGVWNAKADYSPC